LPNRCGVQCHSCDNIVVTRKARLRKVVDDTDQVRCGSGSYGILREEVYVDASETIVKYNLVFIHFSLCRIDNGRVLGHENAHGRHERHWMGSVQPVQFVSYEQTLRRFLEEVETLKEKA
jgi:hypothetical protein